MILTMKKRLIPLVLALTFALSVPAVSYARSDEEGPTIDARLDGYKDGNMGLKDASGSVQKWNVGGPSTNRMAGGAQLVFSGLSTQPARVAPSTVS